MSLGLWLVFAGLVSAAAAVACLWQGREVLKDGKGCRSWLCVPVIVFILLSLGFFNLGVGFLPGLSQAVSKLLMALLVIVELITLSAIVGLLFAPVLKKKDADARIIINQELEN